MKRNLVFILAALALFATPQLRAWTYSDGDLLLIFRNGGNDVEFNLGSVTQFLGKTNGYTTAVSGFDWSLVTGTFGNLSSVRVILLASVDATNWLSSNDPNTTAYNIGSPAADSLYSVIKGIGTKPLYPIAIPTSGANSYVIDTGGLYKNASYEQRCAPGQVGRDFHHQRRWRSDLRGRPAPAQHFERHPERQCQPDQLHHHGGQYLFTGVHQPIGRRRKNVAGGCR